MIDFSEIDRCKAILDQHRPLDPAITRNLREDLIVRWTYNSNAIEGNTLTLRETKVALEGITIGGKTLREHLEAVNHRDAICYLEQLVEKREPLSEWTIRSLHQLILKGIDDTHAGVYRTFNVRIAGADHEPPDHVLVPELMERLIAWYHERAAQRLREAPPLCRWQWTDFATVDELGVGEGGLSRGGIAGGETAGLL